ncbi:MAG TPA: sigma-70 family RNA polymerase sigma factor [Chthonomonadales bacterium]|nr:sigma-70 family RNA polymerase sigma factor [Chthonomonadales bacterium]
MLDDRELVRRTQSGDRRAFEQLLDRYEARIYRMALRTTGNPADAEDVTQEIFLGIHRSIGSFRSQSALSTWVYRVALNHCLEHRRKRRLDTVTMEDEMQIASARREDDPVACATQTELAARVNAAIGSLSGKHRDVVLLHEMQGLTYQECAEVLNVPVGTVKSRLFHAFGQLRALLAGSTSEEA